MTSSDDSQERFCDSSSLLPYQVFNDDGTPFLPCGKSHCATKCGKPCASVPTTCAHAQCGKRIFSSCPGIIFCSQECFEATGTQAEWEETQRKRQRAKARSTRYLATENGKKKRSEQNKRCYGRRKSSGKTQAAYTRKKGFRQISDLSTLTSDTKLDEVSLANTSAKLQAA
jgi:hypothetical protein